MAHERLSTIEKMARNMYERERQRMDRLCADADAAVGAKVHVSTMLPFESCNLLYEEAARDALEAMREPSEAVWAAGEAVETEGTAGYRAMIDAILEGK